VDAAKRDGRMPGSVAMPCPSSRRRVGRLAGGIRACLHPVDTRREVQNVLVRTFRLSAKECATKMAYSARPRDSADLA
jgi:hypothetical protein